MYSFAVEVPCGQREQFDSKPKLTDPRKTPLAVGRGINPLLKEARAH